MTSLARLTQPFSRLDGPINALTDATVRRMPWTWWPVGPPRADRPMTARHHAVSLGWSAVVFVAGEVAVPTSLQSSGRRLRAERAATVLLSLALWALGAGAWDRRAERLRRRPWKRLATRRGRDAGRAGRRTRAAR